VEGGQEHGGEISHNCGQHVDRAMTDACDTTLTGTDEVHRLWI